MISSTQHRAATQLSGRLSRHLSQYALAASAAGVGLLALAQPAEAKIVYKSFRHTLTDGKLPIPVAGTEAFTLFDYFVSQRGHTNQSTQSLSVLATASAGIAGSFSASALAAGRIIGPKNRFKGRHMAFAYCATTRSLSTVGRPFANVTNRFLGLKFKLSGQVHYGWVRFSKVSAHACKGGPDISATLTGYAYETIPGKPIIAGKTKGPDVITVHEGSLGHLAVGRK